MRVFITNLNREIKNYKKEEPQLREKACRGSRLVRVTGDVASASGGRFSEHKEALRSTIAPRSKRGQSRAPQE